MCLNAFIVNVQYLHDGMHSHEDITLTMFCIGPPVKTWLLDGLGSLLSLHIHAWPCNYYHLLFVYGYIICMYVQHSLFGTTIRHDAFVLV